VDGFEPRPVGDAKLHGAVAVLVNPEFPPGRLVHLRAEGVELLLVKRGHPVVVLVLHDAPHSVSRLVTSAGLRIHEPLYPPQ